MAGSVRATLLGLLIQILCNGLAGQQLLLTRPQRSLFEDPLGHVEQVEQVEHLPSLGWSGVGGGLGVGEWPYSTVGLGHMSKDELLTLLEAWKEVEEESATTTTAPPADATTRRPPPPPLPPPPPPPPRPIPVSVAMPAPALPPSGTPITVRLPAFVPVRLAAVFTPPASGQAGSAASSANEVGEAGGDDLATEEMPDDGVTTRLFRFLPMPRARTRPQSNSQNRQQFVVRNTLDSVDAGTAPVRQQVKPEVQPKATAPPSTPKFPGYPTPSFRPRFGVPPSLANARFELVPSSQIIGDWRV